MLTRNEGLIDRVLRLTIGAALLVTALVLPLTGVAAVAAFALAVILTVTALVGVCPLYSLLGINTCARRGSPQS